MTKAHWTEYWKSGVLTSLPSDFKENYDGELAEYWQSVINNTDNGADVLDVCTGNGAVALLMRELADKANLKINSYAVDASDINPQVIVKSFPDKKQFINEILFYGNCLVEEMASKLNHKFDLIVSQYGIEYCDTVSAAENVVSLLKPYGKLIFIAHSPNTAMLDFMKEEDQVFSLLDQLKVFTNFKNFASNKTSANSFKSKLKASLEQLSQMHQFKNQGLFNSWGQAMFQLYKLNNQQLKEKRSWINDFNNQYLHAWARAKDMLKVSVKLINDDQWYKPFVDQGLVLLKEGEINYKGQHNVGHYYEFSKVN